MIKKILIVILFIFCMSLNVFAQGKKSITSFGTGLSEESVENILNGEDEENLYFTTMEPLLVRSSNPTDNKNFSRPLATLPVGIKVYILFDEQNWTNIKWYSTSSKEYKYGWIPTIWANLMTQKQSLNEVLKIGISNISSLNDLSDEMHYLINKNQNEDALEIANKIISNIFVFTDITKKPVDKTLKSMLTTAYLTKANYFMLEGKDYKSALNCIDEAIYYDNNTIPLLYYLKGLIYEEQGYYSKAKNCYLKEKTRSVTNQNEGYMIKLNERINYANKMINLAR